MVSWNFQGCGDYTAADISYLPDPCPLPDKLKKRKLDDRERLIYAPMSGVGGVVFDKDAVYIDLQGSHSHHTGKHTYVRKNYWHISKIPFLGIAIIDLNQVFV